MDRRDDLVELAVLAQAVDGAGIGQRLPLAQVRRCRQTDHRRARVCREHGRGGLDAVHPRQPVVHQHDIGAKLARERDRFAAVLRGADDLDVGPKPEHELQTLAEDSVVLDQDDANR